MSTAELAYLLRNIAFFRDVNYPLHDLAGKMTMVRFNEGENIFKEGEDGDCLYLIISGRVLIHSMSAAGKEVVIQTLEQSDFFGEMCLLDGGKRSASARAMEETIVFCLEREDFLEILYNYPQTALKVNETLSKRLRLANARIKILTGATCDSTGQPVNTAAGGESVPGQKEDGPVEDTEQAYKEDVSEDCEKILYHAKIACPVCAAKFQSTRVKSGSIRVKSIDSDFCKHYESTNPLYYEIMVCPQCGFAFDLEASKMRLSAEQREKLKLRLQPVWQGKDYSGRRTLKDAIETFQLALYALESELVKSSKMGMLCLKTAWLHRYAGDGAGEEKYIETALLSLEQAYEKESFSDPKSELNLAYLLGALNIKVGKYQEAAKWLERVLRHPAKSMLPMVVNQAKDLWTEVRQKLREDKQE